jgi:endonuclease VIII
MPEGPEIARAAARITEALVGEPLTHVWFDPARRLPPAEDFVGETVLSVRARGKALLIAFSNGVTMYSHNQLYGVWKVVAAERYPKTGRSLRVELRTARRAALLYSATDIAMLTRDEIGAHPYLAPLGPDVIDPSTTVSMVLGQLRSKTFRRRSLGALLLDQRFLAGVGNYLRTEILHAAKVHPQKAPMHCTPVELQALARAALALPRRALEHAGITNDLKRAARLKKQGASRFSYRHAAFSRNGKPCYRCGDSIVKETHAGRRVYLCPTCQAHLR